MLKTYIAQQTKSFTDGQVLADITKGQKYQADKEQEYFIGNFGDTIYIAKDHFEDYFRVQRLAGNKKAINKYFKNNSKVLYLRLFVKTDKDIIDFLETIKEPRKDGTVGRAGVSEYIRQLIRQDMQKQDFKGE